MAQNGSTTFNESGDTVAEQVTATATQWKEKVSDLSRTAVNKIDGSRESAADGLDSAASALQGKAEKVTGMAQTTAEKLNSAADYLRQHNVKNMMSDVEELVRKNPGPALVAAVVIGFLTARAFSSRND